MKAKKGTKKLKPEKEFCAIFMTHIPWGYQLHAVPYTDIGMEVQITSRSPSKLIGEAESLMNRFNKLSIIVGGSREFVALDRELFSNAVLDRWGDVYRVRVEGKNPDGPYKLLIGCYNRYDAMALADKINTGLATPEAEQDLG